LLPKQFSVFEALDPLGPTAIVRAVKSAVEYANVHCKPAGCVPAEVNERLSATVLPGEAVFEERASDTCADAGVPTLRRKARNGIVLRTDIGLLALRRSRYTAGSWIRRQTPNHFPCPIPLPLPASPGEHRSLAGNH
jgi:hypothetical protein